MTAASTERPLTAADEVKRLVALAVASGVTTYRALARAAGRSNTLAQHWGDPDEEGDLPAFALVTHPELRAFVLPQLLALAERLAVPAPVVPPEAGLNVVLARIAEWIAVASEVLADMRVDPAEAKRLLGVAHRLRAAIDRAIVQLAARAAEVH